MFNWLFARVLILKVVGFLVLGSCVVPLPSQAQAWPERTVRLLTPFGAGGGSDAIARIVADRMAKRWNKPVVVENKPGADGFLAVSESLDLVDAAQVLIDARLPTGPFGLVCLQHLS